MINERTAGLHARPHFPRGADRGTVPWHYSSALAAGLMDIKGHQGPQLAHVVRSYTAELALFNSPLCSRYLHHLLLPLAFINIMQRQDSYQYSSSGLPSPKYSTSNSTSSAFSASANPNEDWTKISDLAERRRIQNRIAQRNYRESFQLALVLGRQY